MPTLKIPFVGSYNNRSFATVAGKDQFIKAAIITPIVNRQSRTVTYYVEKRGGLTASATPESGGTGLGVFLSNTTYVYSAFVTSGTVTVYRGETSCGVLATGTTAPYIYMNSEVIISGVTYVLLTLYSTTASPTAWFIPSDAITGLTFTGDTHTNTTIDNVSSLTGLYVGQAISGTGIQAGTRIATISSPSTITTTLATTATNAGITITREAVAKIIDADFPQNAGETIVGALVDMDGYLAIMTVSSRVYNSDLNSLSSWTSTSWLTCSNKAGKGLGLAKMGNKIVAFLNTAIEFLYNAGNPSGSPFSTSENAIDFIAGAPWHARVITSHNGRVYWQGGDYNFYTFNGLTPTLISTLGVGVSANVASLTQLTSFSYNKKDYLNYKSGTINIWWSITDETFVDANFSNGAYCFSNDITPLVVLGDTSGKTYTLSTTNFQDNAAAFTMSIQIATDMGTQKRKHPEELRIIADKQASGTLSVSWSDDDGATYTTARTIDLTDPAEMRLRRLGSFDATRLWKFEHSANTAFRGKLIEIDY